VVAGVFALACSRFGAYLYVSVSFDEPGIMGLVVGAGRDGQSACRLSYLLSPFSFLATPSRSSPPHTHPAVEKECFNIISSFSHPKSSSTLASICLSVPLIWFSSALWLIPSSLLTSNST
jgi:hypothetical protein